MRADDCQTIGFPVSNKKFWLMSILTMGVYQVPWAYNNFRSLQVPSQGKVGNAVFAFFFPFSFFELMKNIELGAKASNQEVHWSKGLLAVSFFLMNGLSNILSRSDQLFLFSIVFTFLGTLTLYRAQKEILRVNREIRPDCPVDDSFKPADFVWLLVLPIIFVVSLIAAMATSS